MGFPGTFSMPRVAAFCFYCCVYQSLAGTAFSGRTLPGFAVKIPCKAPLSAKQITSLTQTRFISAQQIWRPCLMKPEKVMLIWLNWQLPTKTNTKVLDGDCLLLLQLFTKCRTVIYSEWPRNEGKLCDFDLSKALQCIYKHFLLKFKLSAPYKGQFTKFILALYLS